MDDTEWTAWARAQLTETHTNLGGISHRAVRAHGKEAHLFRAKYCGSSLRFAALLLDDGTPYGLVPITSTGRRHITSTGVVQPLPNPQYLNGRRRIAP